MTNDRHFRIRETEEIEGLPAFPDFSVYPRDAMPEEEHEAQRRQEEDNNGVAEELGRKFAGLWGSASWTCLVVLD